MGGPGQDSEGKGAAGTWFVYSVGKGGGFEQLVLAGGGAGRGGMDAGIRCSPHRGRGWDDGN